MELKKIYFRDPRPPPPGGVWDKQLYPWPGFLIFLRSYGPRWCSFFKGFVKKVLKNLPLKKNR